MYSINSFKIVFNRSSKKFYVNLDWVFMIRVQEILCKIGLNFHNWSTRDLTQINLKVVLIGAQEISCKVGISFHDWSSRGFSQINSKIFII